MRELALLMWSVALWERADHVVLELTRRRAERRRQREEQRRRDELARRMLELRYFMRAVRASRAREQREIGEP